MKRWSHSVADKRAVLMVEEGQPEFHRAGRPYALAAQGDSDTASG